MTGRHQPSKATPKDDAHVFSLCATPGQLNHFATLVLQQRSQQSALGEGRGRCRNVISSVFHKHPSYWVDSSECIDNHLNARAAPQR
jgi:hypothetical protein